MTQYTNAKEFVKNKYPELRLSGFELTKINIRGVEWDFHTTVPTLLTFARVYHVNAQGLKHTLHIMINTRSNRVVIHKYHDEDSLYEDETVYYFESDEELDFLLEKHLRNPRDYHLAFMMLTHKRLGADSLFSGLDPHLLQVIFGMSW